MGGGVSFPDKMTEDQLKSVAGDQYTPALYDTLKDSDGYVTKERLQKVYKKTDVFLSHNWAVDEEGRNNHERVIKISDGLKSMGIVTWLDAERMEGNVSKMMCEGIDNASLILIFVTRAYMLKVNSENESDNCQQEFNYARNRKTAKFMLPILMESACRNQSDWVGPVGMSLGNTLYDDYT
eukprot:gene2747-3605_t